MKNYLSEVEKNLWLMNLLTTAEWEDNVDKMKGSTLTPEEVKWVKSAITYNKKAFNSMTERMGEKAIQQLIKYTKTKNIVVISKELSKIQGANKEESISIPADLIDSLAATLVNAKCSNCKSNCGKCTTFSLLQELEMNGYEMFDNCPYSSEKKEVKKKKSRKEKKVANRFDEE
ncbi:MAG: hypothetical protein ACRDD7_06750 [Peptostreptococcaceae bacterium]